MSENSMDVLNELTTLIRDAGQNMMMALLGNNIDWFLRHVKAAKSDLEKLIEYMKQHEKEVSATLNRSNVKDASKHLQTALAIIEKAVNTLPEFRKDNLKKEIQLARRYLAEST